MTRAAGAGRIERRILPHRVCVIATVMGTAFQLGHRYSFTFATVISTMGHHIKDGLASNQTALRAEAIGSGRRCPAI